VQCGPESGGLRPCLAAQAIDLVRHDDGKQSRFGEAAAKKEAITRVDGAVPVGGGGGSGGVDAVVVAVLVVVENGVRPYRPRARTESGAWYGVTDRTVVDDIVVPDLTGTFGFMAGGFYNLATAMVFGSTTSASSWEPFRRGIEALSVAYADCPDLVIKHKYYLDMISWAEEDPTAKITQAFPCLINTGILDAHLPVRIYVNDSLLFGLSR